MPDLGYRLCCVFIIVCPGHHNLGQQTDLSQSPDILGARELSRASSSLPMTTHCIISQEPTHRACALLCLMTFPQHMIFGGYLQSCGEP